MICDFLVSVVNTVHMSHCMHASYILLTEGKVIYMQCYNYYIYVLLNTDTHVCNSFPHAL